MPALDLPFSSSEYDRRLDLVRTEMAERGLDALFVTDPSNQAWLTGYDGWSFYVHQGVIVLPDANPIWWGRNQDTNGALRTVWMTDHSIRGYADGFVQAIDKHPMQDLAVHLAAAGVEAGRIGVEMDNYYYSAKAHAALVAGLPKAQFVDATALVNWKRAVKSEPELAFMRRRSFPKKSWTACLKGWSLVFPRMRSSQRYTATRFAALTEHGAIIRQSCPCCHQGPTRPRRT